MKIKSGKDIESYLIRAYNTLHGAVYTSNELENDPETKTKAITILHYLLKSVDLIAS